MTKIKFCGLSRPCDIATANELKPEYIGFVFTPKSSRYVSPEKAMELKKQLLPGIRAIGVFVNEQAEAVASLLNKGVIDIAQLHGDEDEEYIGKLRTLTCKPVIKAFRVRDEKDISAAESSTADAVLLDSGAGTGSVFDWALPQEMKRPYFLAGGLDARNVGEAIGRLHPYAVDVSSGIETNGVKDKEKMMAFAAAVRKDEKL